MSTFKVLYIEQYKTNGYIFNSHVSSKIRDGACQPLGEGVNLRKRGTKNEVLKAKGEGGNEGKSCAVLMKYQSIYFDYGILKYMVIRLKVIIWSGLIDKVTIGDENPGIMPANTPRKEFYCANKVGDCGSNVRVYQFTYGFGNRCF